MNQYVNENSVINNLYLAYKKSNVDSEGMSSREKLKIKNAVLNIVLILIIFSTVGLLLSKIMITGFENQMPFEINFVQLNPFELFNSSVIVALFIGLYLSFPFITFNLVKLYDEQLKKANISNLFIAKATAITFVLFTLGALFAYFFVIKSILYFVMGFSFNSNLATTAISISNYTSFCLQLILITGLIFELPVFYYVLNKTRVLGSGKLLSKWKTALIVTFVLSFILTSQNIFTQIFSMAGILVLYGLCIFTAKIVENN